MKQTTRKGRWRRGREGARGETERNETTWPPPSRAETQTKEGRRRKGAAPKEKGEVNHHRRSGACLPSPPSSPRSARASPTRPPNQITHVRPAAIRSRRTWRVGAGGEARRWSVGSGAAAAASAAAPPPRPPLSPFGAPRASPSSVVASRADGGGGDQAASHERSGGSTHHPAVAAAAVPGGGVGEAVDDRREALELSADDAALQPRRWWCGGRSPRARAADEPRRGRRRAALGRRRRVVVVAVALEPPLGDAPHVRRDRRLVPAVRHNKPIESEVAGACRLAPPPKEKSVGGMKAPARA